MSQPFPCYLNSSVANSKTRQDQDKSKVLVYWCLKDCTFWIGHSWVKLLQ